VKNIKETVASLRVGGIKTELVPGVGDTCDATVIEQKHLLHRTLQGISQQDQ